MQCKLNTKYPGNECYTLCDAQTSCTYHFCILEVALCKERFCTMCKGECKESSMMPFSTITIQKKKKPFRNL